MNKTIAFRMAGVIGLSLVFFGRITLAQRARREATLAHGRYSLEQIIERSIPLCGALTANNDSLRLAGTPMATWPNGREVPVWIVDGVDARDRFKMHLVWDASTGELLTASRISDSAGLPSGRSLLSLKQAERITSSWLTTLGIFELDSGWRSRSTPMGSDSVWRIEWRTDMRIEAVIIDSHTGELIIAQSMKPAGFAGHDRLAKSTTASGLQRL